MNPFDWAGLGLALFAFLASHAIPARPRIRRRLVDRLGMPLYIFLYCGASIGLLALVFHQAGLAPYVELWHFDEWQRHVVLLLVPISFGIGAVGLTSPNPWSLTASRHAYDSARPGVVAFTRHPVLLALLLWSTAHLVANGDLAHVVLFGTFGCLAVAGMHALDHRNRSRMGAQAWRIALHDLDRQRRRPTLRSLTIFVIGCTVALGFAAIHPLVIGVPAFP